MVVLRLVGLAIHAIASKRQNFYALKPNTWGSYTYSIMSDFMHTGQYSALPCDVVLVKIMTPRVYIFGFERFSSAED